MFKKLSFAVVYSLILVIGVLAQTTPPSLEEVLSEAEKQTANYQETFRNLLAVETKTFVDYDNNQQEKKRNTVESDFLVYQSSKNNKISFELRNVKNVDGKPIPNSNTNSDTFFAELSKTSTLRSELDKLQKSGSKYDKTLDVSGMTLYEGIILSNNLRPFFDFKLEGMEQNNGQEVYLVSYRQNKISPFIAINGKDVDLNNPSLSFNIDIPGGMKKEDVFLRGKMWIDAKTFQIWREERELFVHSAAEPVVLLSTVLDYQTSDYGILVPKQITLTTNQSRKKDGKYITVKDFMIIFDYSKFRKTETDVKILDDTESLD